MSCRCSLKMPDVEQCQMLNLQRCPHYIVYSNCSFSDEIHFAKSLALGPIIQLFIAETVSIQCLLKLCPISNV